MPRTRTAQPKPGGVSQSLAKDRLGVPAVLFFVLAGVAPLTVAAGVIPTAYATTGLTGIPAAFVVIAVILAIFASGYVTMARHIQNAGACYAFISHGLGRTLGVPAALVALLAYSMLQIGLYGALGPAAATEAATYLHIHAPVVGVGARRVGHHHHPRACCGWTSPAGSWASCCAPSCWSSSRETVLGLAHPAGGHLSFATLSPSALTSAGFGTFGVLAVIAVLGFVGFEQAPVLAEEARNTASHDPGGHLHRAGHDRGHLRRRVLGHGRPHRHRARRGRGREARPRAAVRPRRQQRAGPGRAVLFMTSLFAAALSFHNATWRYAFALGRENVLPAALGRTGANNIPKAASLAQSVTAVAVIAIYAVTGQNPMTRLFFWLGHDRRLRHPAPARPRPPSPSWRSSPATRAARTPGGG